jgi:hypothetical protein
MRPVQRSDHSPAPSLQDLRSPDAELYGAMRRRPHCAALPGMTLRSFLMVATVVVVVAAGAIWGWRLAVASVVTDFSARPPREVFEQVFHKPLVVDRQRQTMYVHATVL